MARKVQVSGDTAAAAEAGGNYIYPAGEYVGEIIDVSASKNGFAKSGANAGKPALDVKVRFTESGTGVGEGKKFVAWQVPDFPTFASGKPAFLFFQFYKALGVAFPKDGESFDVELPDFEEIIGQEIGLRLTIEAGSDNPAGGKYPDRNRVGGFFAASKGVVVSKAPAKGTAAAGAVDEDFTL